MLGSSFTEVEVTLNTELDTGLAVSSSTDTVKVVVSVPPTGLRFGVGVKTMP